MSAFSSNIRRRERLMGIETEYAVSGFDHDGNALRPSRIARRLDELARKTWIHLPGCGSGGGGMFLGNGGRFYIDCGDHPEMCTPECTDPSDAVRYLEAGHLMLSRLARRIEKYDPRVSRVVLRNGNVDYSGSLATWACHESYLMKETRQELAVQLLPHLVSRIIFSGAGGFDASSTGIDFEISPRAPHLVQDISRESTCERGIFHTKNERLCSRSYRRVHLLCGDSLSSHFASWLKLGTTALVLRLIEAGIDTGSEIVLTSPVSALRRFSRDTTCRVEVPLVTGRQRSAIEIQRHYLELVQENLDTALMPHWAEDICDHWRGVLVRLEHNPRDLEGKLDWCTKLALYDKHLRSHGFGGGANDPGIRGGPIRRLPSPSRDHLMPPQPARSVETELDRIRALRGRRRALPTPIPFEHADLRAQLFEIDTRWSELGPNGLFQTLDRQGILNHRIPGVGNLERATVDPPALGRANLRGRLIKRFAADPSARCFCQWQGIVNPKTNMSADLSDPFEDTENWKPSISRTVRGNMRSRLDAFMLEDG